MLKDKGILIPCEYDELEKVNSDRILGITRKDSKSIRIWTTSGCNARCNYCFEKGITVINMSENTADQVVRFIDSLLECGDKLLLEWFGGEPLLNEKIIDYIMARIRKICIEKQCSFRSLMITNGSLISERNITKFKNEWGISSVQITLDGYADVYDEIKNYINPGKYNFDRVIYNIKMLCENEVHVNIRLNYDMKNYDSLKRLIEYLHEIFAGNKYLTCYVYPLWDSLYESETIVPYASEVTLDNKYIDLLNDIVRYKLNNIRGLFRLNYRKNQCSSCNEHSFNIFPEGRIGKCSETMFHTLGNVWDGITNEDLYKEWTTKEIDDKCKECVYLPLCQGGCRSSKYTKMKQCFANKDVLPELLKNYVRHMQNEKK